MSLAPPLSASFQQRFAAWLRLEPRCRQDDISRGIQARTADPLWMLCRQWQVGEFRGEDAGSPLQVSLRCSSQAIERLQPGDAPPAPVPGDAPLEAVIEREPSTLDYRERVRVGQEFERRLRTALIGAGALNEFGPLVDQLRATTAIGFPRAPRAPLPTLDHATQRFVRFMRGRVVDGAAVLESALAAPTASVAAQNALDAARQEVLAWYAGVCARPDGLPAAWQSASMDYRFTLNAYPPPGAPDAVPASDQATRLLAPDYRSGTLDWHAFAAPPEGARNWGTTAEVTAFEPTTPTRIEVSGTALRWWAFEDGNTNFGRMEIAKPDLARLLLMEFALIYGDDWFSLPAVFERNRLIRIDALEVRNVFGEVTDVPPASRTAGTPLDRFDVFSVSPAAVADGPGMTAGTPPRPLLFAPPIAGFRLESPILDEVLFLRDEGANMVWAIEHTVANGIGRRVHGFDAQRERIERANEVERAGLLALLDDTALQLLADGLVPEARAALEAQARLARARLEELDPDARPAPPAGSVAWYRLATRVPENWIPFIPVQRAHAPLLVGLNRLDGVRFRRAKMLRDTDHARLDQAVLSPAVVELAAQRLGLPDDAFAWMLAQEEANGVPSASRLLALDDHPLLWVDEATVPRAGLRVQLAKQRVRGPDGTTYVWLGRKVLVGRGEGASGLAFDVVRGPR